MLTATPLPDSDVVEVVVDGGFGGGAVRDAARVVDEVVREHGSVRLLGVVRRIGLVTGLGALRELASSPLLGAVQRAALVTDKGFLADGATRGAAERGLEVRVFPPGQRDAALAWLQQEGATGTGPLG
jgi:alcohol dehydrogenase class IV